MMIASKKYYPKFVKSSLECPKSHYPISPTLSGDEARKKYLEIVQDISLSAPVLQNCSQTESETKEKVSLMNPYQMTDKELLLAVQCDDAKMVEYTIKLCPKKVNLTDEYGWSLLMIACQANSLETFKILLNYGADSSIRDKAGNSVRSLVIKNKNLQLADLLLNHKPNPENKKTMSVKMNSENYVCEICNNKVFCNKELHLSSIIHNINASKDKKIQPCYKIPESNRGFQMMLKNGWNKDAGLGNNGTGIKYPIRTIQKKDRKGLGHKIKETTIDNVPIKHQTRKHYQKAYQRQKIIEIGFRREFY